MTLKMKAGCRHRRGVEKKNSMTAVGMRKDERTVPRTRNFKLSLTIGSRTKGDSEEVGREGLLSIAPMESQK